MSAGTDLFTIILAAGVIAVFGVFFWLVGSGIVMRVRQLAWWHDGAAERQRASLEHEAKHGPAPLWLKTMRVALVAALVGILGLRLWMRMAHA